MSQPTSVDGCLHVWKLHAGVKGAAIDLGPTKGWSVQVDGELGGGKILFEASNNGHRFYPVDTLATPGLFTLADEFRWYRPALNDADQHAAVIITIYVY